MIESPNTAVPAVSFRHVTKLYGTVPGVRDVSFDWPSHKVIGLIGPNGGGKSTLLKLAAGLLRPTSGEVLVNGQARVGRISAEVAFLGDADMLYPFYNVREMTAYCSGVFPDFSAARAQQLLDFMELSPDTRVSALSKRGLARLKIALTVSRDASLLLMDEPLSGLDPMVRESLIKGLVSFVDLDRQTLVVSTHEVTEVEPLLDIAMIVFGGRIRASEAVEHVHEGAYPRGLVGWMADQVGRAAVSKPS